MKNCRRNFYENKALNFRKLFQTLFKRKINFKKGKCFSNARLRAIWIIHGRCHIRWGQVSLRLLTKVLKPQHLLILKIGLNFGLRSNFELSLVSAKAEVDLTVTHWFHNKFHTELILESQNIHINMLHGFVTGVLSRKCPENFWNVIYPEKLQT